MEVMSRIPEDINRRVGARVRELRTSRRLSLEALARRSGVSRSMISLVERGEASPTAVVLERLAAALDVTLASLFDAPVPPASPVARRAEQPVWRDPGSGYVRRNVTAAGAGQPARIVGLDFPAGARVAFDTGRRDVPVLQQVWVLQGTICVREGSQEHRLDEGDCLSMRLDGPTLFHNPTDAPARYAVVIAAEGAA